MPSSRVSDETLARLSDPALGGPWVDAAAELVRWREVGQRVEGLAVVSPCSCLINPTVTCYRCTVLAELTALMNGETADAES